MLCLINYNMTRSLPNITTYSLQTTIIILLLNTDVKLYMFLLNLFSFFNYNLL